MTQVKNAINVLKSGKTLLYPADTVWGIGCDATNVDAVKKIYTLKKRAESKAMICLVSDFEMLKYYIENIPEMAIDLIKSNTKPTTFIFNKPIHIAKNLIAEDGSLAVRIVTEGFTHQLIKKLNKPIVSTSANIANNPTPKSFKEISSAILKGVDYVVDLPHEKINAKPSTIIKLNNDGTIKIIRE
jgi:L-threonylcarbamoyladenylate synthase